MSVDEKTSPKGDEEVALTLREYQKRVVEAALKGNTLAILPTGSGKTLIATYIIRERLKVVRQQIEDGEPKKLVAFLAPTKILVGQQLRYLSKHSDAVVVEFTGETHTLEGHSVGYWNYNGWTDVFAKQEVIVMTPQIMKQMLQRKFFKIENFDCVVIDECHHAFGHNPLITICTMIKESTAQPLLFAMTASPLVSKRRSVMSNLTLLEQNLNCKVLCGKEILDEYKKHTPVAELSLFRYAPPKSNLMEKLMLNTDTFLLDKKMKDVDTNFVFPKQVLLPERVSCLLLHAYLRAKHSSTVSTLYCFLETMRISITEIGSVWSDRFPSVELCKYYQTHGTIEGVADVPVLQHPTNHILKSSVTSVSKIHDLAQTLGQILMIVEECGILCGIYAFMTALGARKISRKHNLSKLPHGKGNKRQQNQFASKNNSTSHNKGSKAVKSSGKGMNKHRLLSSLMNSKAKQNAKANQSTRAMSLVMDMDKLNVYAKELRSSPFKVIDLVHDEYIACTCILDFFFSFAFAFGPNICRRASIKYIQNHKKDKGYTFTFPIQVIKEFIKQGQPQTKIKILHVPKHHALIYLLLQAVVQNANNNIKLPLTSEGCLVLLPALWVQHIDQTQVMKDFREYIFHEEFCRDAVGSAIFWMLKNINVDELKGWSEMDDEARLLTIEPLLMQKQQEGEKNIPVETQDEEELSLEKTATIIDEIGNVDDQTSNEVAEADNLTIEENAKYQMFPVFEMVTSKVKALCQIWHVIGSSSQQVEWLKNQEQLLDAIMSRSAVNTTASLSTSDSVAANDYVKDMMSLAQMDTASLLDQLRSSSSLQSVEQVVKQEKLQLLEPLEEGEIEESAVVEEVELPENASIEKLEDDERNEPQGLEEERNIEVEEEENMNNFNDMENDDVEDENRVVETVSADREEGPGPVALNNKSEITTADAKQHCVDGMISTSESLTAPDPNVKGDAYIVFCKMRLNAVSLHFVLSMILENVFDDEFSPENEEEEELDELSYKYMRNEVTCILKDMLGAVEMKGNSKFNYRKRICLEKDLVTPPNFRPTHLIGSINQRRQLGVLRLFKEGKYNIVFATEVMEEGLDVRACKYVINFDLPSTAKSFVQRKGRSRAEHSMMVSLIPFGNDGEKMISEMKSFCHQEKTVEEITNEQQTVHQQTEEHLAVDLNVLLMEESHEITAHHYQMIDETKQLLEFDGGFDLLNDFMCEVTTTREVTTAVEDEDSTVTHRQDGFPIDCDSSVLASDNMILGDDDSVNALNSSSGLGTLLIARSNDMTGVGSLSSKEIALQAKYIVESTGSEADIRSSRLILQKFCQQLPHDLAYIPQPIFWISKVLHPTKKNLTQFSCSILLPPYVPPYLRFIVGPMANSKSIAKGLAALEAVKLLHHHKELNDWLLTNGSKASAKMENARNLSNNKDATESSLYPNDQRKSNRKRKLSARVSEDIVAENVNIIDEKIVADQGLKVNEEDKDLLQIPIKVIPDVLTMPAAWSPTPPQYSQESPNAINNHEQDGVLLYLYAVETKFSAQKARYGTINCSSCHGLFSALNQFGIAYTQPLPEDVVETMFRGYIREQDGIDMKVTFLQERLATTMELIHMQRFHKSILCWETDLPNEADWIEYDANVLDMFPNLLQTYPISHDDWRASSNGAWYVIFPLPDWLTLDRTNEADDYLMSYLSPSLMDHEIFKSRSCFLSYMQQSANEVQVLVHNLIILQQLNKCQEQADPVDTYYPPIIQPRTLSEMIGVMVVRGNGTIQVVCEDTVQFDTQTNESILCQKKLSHICKFVNKSQVEHPRLVVTIAMKEIVDKIVALHEEPLLPTVTSTVSTSDDTCTPKLSESEPNVSNVTNQISSQIDNHDLESKDEVGSDINATTASAKSSEKYPNAPETPTPIPKRKKQRVDPKAKVSFTADTPVSKASAQDDLVPITFLDIFAQRYPDYEDFFLDVAKSSEHTLWRVVSVASRLTLHCLFTKTANRFIKPNEKRLYDSVVRMNNSNNSNNTKSPNGSSKKPLKPKQVNNRKLHTHASTVYVIPELLRPLGKYKWFAIGIMAPSVIWRIQSLLHAVEGRKLIVDLILRARHCNTPIISDLEPLSDENDDLTEKPKQDFTDIIVSTEQYRQSLPCTPEIEAERQSILSISPNATLMLESLTPRLAEEIIDSERVELLGDSLLKLVTSVELYRLFPYKHEGFLTNERIKVISNIFLLEMSCKLGLHHYIRGISLSNGKQLLKIRPCGMSFEAIKENRNVWNNNLQVAVTSTVASSGKKKDADSSSEVDKKVAEDLPMINLDDIHNTQEYFAAIYSQPLHEYVEVKPKILADTIESIIGAFYLSGGVELGIDAVKALGAWPQIEAPVLPPPELFKKDESSSATVMPNEQTISDPASAINPSSLIVAYQPQTKELTFPEQYPDILKRVALGSLYIKDPSVSGTNDEQGGDNTNNILSGGIDEENLEDYDMIPEEPVVSQQPTQFDSSTLSFLITPTPENASKIINQLEEILNYRFQHWPILQEALTHCSCQESQSNQRLEFLGDAVLDFVVVVLLYKHQLWAECGDLSQQKQTATCNKNLGYVGAQLQLYQFLKFHSQKLNNEFEVLHDSMKKLLSLQQVAHEKAIVRVHEETVDALLPEIKQQQQPSPTESFLNQQQVALNEDNKSESCGSTLIQSDIDRSSNEFNHILRPMDYVAPSGSTLSLAVPEYIGISKYRPPLPRDEVGAGKESTDGELKTIPEGNEEEEGGIIDTTSTITIDPALLEEAEQLDLMLSPTSIVLLSHGASCVPMDDSTDPAACCEPSNPMEPMETNEVVPVCAEVPADIPKYDVELEKQQTVQSEQEYNKKTEQSPPPQAVNNSNNNNIRSTILSPKVVKKTMELGNTASKAIADLFEALIGAIYLDSQGDLDAVTKVIVHINLLPQLNEDNPAEWCV